MFRKIFHIIQLLVHIYYMHWDFTYYGMTSFLQFWNQIKFFTNYSNLNMFWFLIPIVITDIRNFNKKEYTYSQRTILVFQLMNPVMFIVTSMYWLMYMIDPRLLFGDRDGSSFDQVLMFYLHGGSFILMQIEYFITPIIDNPRHLKAKSFCAYTLSYLGIYGIHWGLFQEHVYGFQSMMTITELILMYCAIFLILFVVDQIYSLTVLNLIPIHKKHLKMQVQPKTE